jgi:DNA-binding Lrp family transcriptional regulator
VIDWWGEVDRAIVESLIANGPMTPAELAKSAGISETEATAFLAVLAREGKVRICLVAAAAA